jgi:hypothetical protein
MDRAALGVFALAAACGGGGGVDVNAGYDALKVSVANGTVETTVNQPVPSVSPIAASGGSGGFTFAAAGLPSGVAMDANGALSGSPIAPGTVTVTVTVTDKQTAKTASQSFTVIVNQRPAVTVNPVFTTVLLTQNGKDSTFTPASGTFGTAPLVFSISPALPAGMTMNAATGAISGRPTSAAANGTFTVTITDRVGAAVTGTFAMTVSPAIAVVTGDTVIACTVGTVCAFAPLTASAGSGGFVYTVSPALPAALTLNSATGAITGLPAAGLVSTIFRVTATDITGASVFRDARLTINAPVTATATSAVVASTINVPFATAFPAGIRPVTGAGGSGALTYTIAPTLPAALAFNTSTGAITGTPAAVFATSTFTVTVRDQTNSTASATFTLTINGALSTTTAVASKVCTQNALCEYTPVTASGGTSPRVFGTNPALPAGMSIGSTGAITGSPTVTLAATNFVATVTDAVGATSSSNFSLTVNTQLTTTLQAPSYACTISTACAFTAVTASGGTAPITFSVTPALPAGIALTASNGAIGGNAPSPSPSTTYRVTATDAAGATSFKEFVFAVNGPLTSTVVTPTVASTTAVPFATAFPSGVRPVQGAGGTGTLLYAVSPSMPAGLSFNSATGAITGTPNSPLVATAFTVTISDQAGASVSKSFTLTINPAISPTVVTPTKVCTQLAQCTFTAVSGTGGTGTLTYALSPALPASLTFVNGIVGGTATAVLPATTYTVTVTDAVGATASATFSLLVNTALVTTATITEINCGETNGCTVALPYVPVTVTGGTAPVTLALSGGALPSGMTFNTTTGALSGLPNSGVGVPQTLFNVTASDAAGATSGKSFLLGSLRTIVPLSVWTLNIFQFASFQPVVATGGKGTLTYSISPQLPSGFSMSSATGVVNGSFFGFFPAAVFTVTVTDQAGRTSVKTFIMQIL